MKKTIQTVTGPIDATALGVTLMHEHVFVHNPEVEAEIPSPEWDEDACIAVAVAGMKELKTLGVDAMVDLSVIGLGRDVAVVRRIAEQADFNVVVATGYYTFRDLPSFFHNHGPGLMVDGPDPLHEMFVREITTGIRDTGIRAGVIKVATDEPGFTKDVRRVFEAAVRAHKDTGVPISSHTNAKMKGGLEQQTVFRELGMDLSRTVIGHCGDSTDLDYLRALMDAGSYIGLDRFGLTWFLSDEKRTEVLIRLIELGYAERLTISHDAGYFSFNTEPSYRAKALPEWKHTLIPSKILPAIRKAGISDDQIRQIMVENPIQILGLPA